MDFSSSSNSSSQKKVDVRGVKINVEVVGNGPQTLLCMPGVLGTIESDFTPQLKDLQKDFTVVAWDPPGYGKSRPPPRDLSGGHRFYYRDADAAHELMQNLGFKKFSIFGWSDGGITGLILAALYPSSVEKLITLGANAYVDQTDIASVNAIKSVDSWSRKMVEPLLKVYGHDYLQRMWTEFCEAYEEMLENGGDICKDKLKDIKCPTLIVQGAKDAMVGVEHAEFLHQNISGSKLYIMPEGKHNLHLRYPDEFNALVREFMSSQSRK
jgi:valacyclovir hydrolase